jgi:hypothetical protein
MPNRLRPFLLTATPLALSALALTSACGGDTAPKTLFDENGAWTLVGYDIDQGSFADLDENRQDAFLLSFAKSEHVVTAATCGHEGEDEPSNSLCNLDDTSPWACRCFSYAFEDDQMLWHEFPPGSIPPPAPDIDGGGADGVMATGTAGETGAPMGDTLITVGEVADVANSYTFAPLPLDLFDSNGTTARFKFEARGATLFESRVFGMAEGNPPCPQRCVMP